MTSVDRQKDSYLRQYIPPWREPYVIAMAGSSGSGKTSIAQTIIKELNVSAIACHQNQLTSIGPIDDDFTQHGQFL